MGGSQRCRAPPHCSPTLAARRLVIPFRSQGRKANPSGDTLPLATLTLHPIITDQQMVCKELLGFLCVAYAGLPASVGGSVVPTASGKREGSGLRPQPRRCLEPWDPLKCSFIRHHHLISCLCQVLPEPQNNREAGSQVLT